MQILHCNDINDLPHVLLHVWLDEKKSLFLDDCNFRNSGDGRGQRAKRTKRKTIMLYDNFFEPSTSSWDAIYIFCSAERSNKLASERARALKTPSLLARKYGAKILFICEVMSRSALGAWVGWKNFLCWQNQPRNAISELALRHFETKLTMCEIRGG